MGPHIEADIAPRGCATRSPIGAKRGGLNTQNLEPDVGGFQGLGGYPEKSSYTAYFGISSAFVLSVCLT